MVSKASTHTATIGWSAKPDALRCGREAAEQALSALPARPKVAIVFGSSWLEQPLLLHGIRSVLGEIPVVGGSTAGEIVPQGPATHSCVVVLIASEGLQCSIGIGENADRAPREAGQQAAYAAVGQFRGSQRTAMLMFGDGLINGYTDIARGVQEVLGTSFLMAGGMAGDDLRFTQTYQYANDRVLSRSVVGLLLGGPLTVGVGIEHGFAPISKPRRITRAHANVLQELDGSPAASVYEEYFGVEALARIRQAQATREAAAYPLGIQHGSSKQWLLRQVVSFEGNGSLACSGEIREGEWLQLMMGSRQLAIEAASRAARQAIRSLNRVTCALIFDSASRRRLLGPHDAALEIEQIRDALGSSTPFAGCYTYGEHAAFGPGSSYDRTIVQSGSVLVVALGT